MMRPLGGLPPAARRGIRGVLFDIADSLSGNSRLAHSR